MRIIGGLVFVLGIFLFCGNVIGFFRTVPLAGWATMAIGGWIMRAGEPQGARRY